MEEQSSVRASKEEEKEDSLKITNKFVIIIQMEVVNTAIKSTYRGQQNAYSAQDNSRADLCSELDRVHIQVGQVNEDELIRVQTEVDHREYVGECKCFSAVKNKLAETCGCEFFTAKLVSINF